MRALILAVVLATSATARAETAADRARALIAVQLAAFGQATDAPIRPLFAPDAVLVGYALDTAGKDANGFYVAHRIAGITPHVSIRKHAITSLVAGGDASTLWFTAELALTLTGGEPGERNWRTKPLVVRFTELCVRDAGGWKIVAAVFDRPHRKLAAAEDDAVEPIAGATAPGPLTALLASPAALAAALGTDRATFVVGTAPGERAVGRPAAARLLARWRELALTTPGVPREVHTATWGFAQAHVRWKRGGKEYAMFGLVIAVPGADGAWVPVGVHYTGLR